MEQAKSVGSEGIKISGDVVFEKVGEELILLNLESGAYFGLNSVGRRMWELVLALGSPERMVECLLNEFDVSREILERDLANLIRELKEKRLIKGE